MDHSCESAHFLWVRVCVTLGKVRVSCRKVRLWESARFLMGMMEKCTFLVGQVRVSCNIPRGKTHSVAVFLGCA